MFRRNRTPQDPSANVRSQIGILQTERQLNEADPRGLLNRPKYVKAMSTLIDLGVAGIPALLEVLAEKHDDLTGHKIGVGNDVVEVLGKIGDARCVEPLGALLGQAVGVEFALARMPEALGLQALLDGIADPVPVVRASAAAGLGTTRSRPDDVLAALTIALGDGSHFVRAGAATSIGNIGHSDPHLLSALSALARDDSHDMVRRAASRALDDLAQK